LLGSNFLGILRFFCSIEIDVIFGESFHVTQGLHRARELSALHFGDLEDDAGVEFLVEGQLASLAEGFVATRKITCEGLLACVNVRMFFQILSQCEGLEADGADVLLHLDVGLHVPPEGEFCCVSFVTSSAGAGILSFHCRNL
jgi:hypothetical protein